MLPTVSAAARRAAQALLCWHCHRARSRGPFPAPRKGQAGPPTRPCLKRPAWEEKPPMTMSFAVSRRLPVHGSL
eukprot:591852-Lingulodinium_polyedra.AAC.1